MGGSQNTKTSLFHKNSIYTQQFIFHTYILNATKTSIKDLNSKSETGSSLVFYINWLFISNSNL